jgi:hypothetical protein
MRSETVRARLSVSAVFAVHGAVTGSFAARIPWIQAHAGLNSATLGLALLAPTLGSLSAMPFAGRLIHRFGGRSTTRVAVALWCAALALPALPTNLPVLAAVMVFYGASAGMSDVMMNAVGVEVEGRTTRPIMSSLHGLWSVGSLLGSGAGALAAQANVDARISLGTTAVVLIVTGWLVSHGLPETSASAGDNPAPKLGLPSRAVLTIGMVGFCAAFAEMSSQDWCAVYLQHVTGASPAISASAYTGFACTMALSRLSGDVAVHRFGVVRTVRVCAVLGVLGGVLVVLTRTAPLSILGFALIGIGIAVVLPRAFAAAATTGTHPGQAIAGVATLSYGAGLAAPAAVGGIAAGASLPVAFGLVTLLIVGVVLGAGTLRPRTKT